MSLVAAFLPPNRLLRLRGAAGARHDVTGCADWQELTRLCESAPVQTAVIDFCATGEASFDELRVLRGRFPRLAVVGYVSLPPARIQDVFDAGRYGLEGLLVADEGDTPAAIQAVLARAETRSISQLLRAAVGSVDRVARDALLYSVTRANTRLTPVALARQLNLSRRALAQRLMDAGFPPPQRLVTWGRLIAAGQILGSTRTSADAIALALQFPSGSAFRNTCQRYLHATPSEIRRRGGAPYVTRALMRQLRPRAAAGSPLAARSGVRAPVLAV